MKISALIKVFIILSKNKFISEDDLLLHGFTNKDINNLVKNGILKYDDVFYSINSIDKMYEYGIFYLENSKFKEAKECFNACILVDSNYSLAYYMLFLICLKHKSYKKIFDYYDGFESNPKFCVQARIFLYLLSKLIDVPSKYYADLKIEDIHAIKSGEEIKQFICSQNFIDVEYAVSKYLQCKENLTFSDKVMSTVLERVKHKNKRRRDKILNLIINENYEELVDYLENIEKITKFQKYVLKLARVIVLNPGIYSSVECHDVFEAIDKCNFKQAFDMVVDRNERMNLNEENSVMFVLLKRINQDLGFVKREENPIVIEEKHEYSDFINQIYINGLALIYKDDLLFSKVDEILEREPNLKVFYSDDYVAFKYSPVNIKSMDYKKLIRDAEQAYRMNNLHASLKCYRRVLESEKTEPFVFGRLGLIYLKLNKVKLAVEYLRVATDLSIKYGGNFDFTELLDIIDSKGTYEGEVKPYIEFSVKDFRDDITFNNSKISKYVESILNGKEYLNTVGCLSLEEQQMVSLNLAREYYYLGEYKLGDYILRMLERSGVKSKKVVSLLLETRVNKPFYKYRSRG